MDHVHAQDEYVDKLPHPPRLVIPPPHPSTQEIKFDPIPTHSNSVFEGLSIETSYVRSEWGSWDYSDRQRAQAILPCLMLGPFGVARNPHFLHSESITMVLAVVFTRPGQPPITPAIVRMAQQDGLETHTISASSNQGLIAQFPNATQALDRHFTNRKVSAGNLGKVFVCCASGNELSAATVIAYLLETTKMGLVAAIQLAQYQRFCMNLDDAMKHTLQTYEDIVVARREIKSDPIAARAPRRQSIMCKTPVASNVFMRRGSKRTFDEGGDGLDGNDDAIMTNGVAETQPARSFMPFSGG